MRMMASYYAPGDKVVIYGAENSREGGPHLKKELESSYPGIKVIVADSDVIQATGFEFHDSATGEVISYMSTGGTYHLARAEAVLSVYRDRPPRTRGD